LTNELSELENKLDSTNDVTTYHKLDKQIQKVKDELLYLDNKKTEWLILWSKVQWHEKGEKSNKFFLNLEKHRKKGSSVRI